MITAKEELLLTLQDIIKDTLQGINVENLVENALYISRKQALWEAIEAVKESDFGGIVTDRHIEAIKQLLNEKEAEMTGDI